MADLLPDLRTYLASKNLVRDPRTAGTPPPLWLEPRDGAIIPGEKSGDENDGNLVISAYRSGGAPVGEFEDALYRRDTVDLFLIGRTAKAIFDAEPPLRTALVKADAADVPRTAWTMGSTQVIQSILWRPLQPVSRGEDGYVFVISFLFETYLV